MNRIMMIICAIVFPFCCSTVGPVIFSEMASKLWKSEDLPMPLYLYILGFAAGLTGLAVSMGFVRWMDIETARFIADLRHSK